MKIGMNLLLWATHVTEEHYPDLEQIKAAGFDGVEIPIFTGDDAHYRNLRKKLDELQLKASAVTVVPPEASPISPDPTRVWRDFFKRPDEVLTEGSQFARDTLNAA